MKLRLMRANKWTLLSLQNVFVPLVERARELSGIIWEDTAKFILNLDVNSAYYDPKTRSMREDPLPDADPNELYGGDNQYRMSGQALEFKQLNIHAWEAFDKGQDIHMQAAPSQAELLFRNYKVIKEKVK
ncbi:hypothetical protein J1N35_005018 [Gossypium stocksii]|uniref:Pre-mRNA-splicing factor SLU7 n=1 Tax=Gossypium stocksii TaxID=47602 RepID=A0A9D3WDU8_9ROSI|nr:hypothetical protein J1N35_005018 [Gossypium stocksii]